MTSETISVSKLMNRNVQTDYEDQNIMSASNIMYANDIGSVIIVTRSEDRSPVGIITERDIVRILGKLNPELLNTPLKTLMSTPLITVEETASMVEASKLMNDKKIRRLVVVDRNNKMNGILTQKDIFTAINKDPHLFSEFYGENFSSNFKAVYEKFNQYRLENLMPEFKEY
ncbi:MAG TPA: CBS domain-containing protein [Nitrososphaeraceae archaeon]|jgi:predicted transcriptional regulator|nr:CBS domain-containing protein [Nitrososphaeraceae archaeon]